MYTHVSLRQKVLILLTKNILVAEKLELQTI
jgi:hypothetical protein